MDYMKGYNNRRKKRRASKRRTSTGRRLSTTRRTSTTRRGNRLSVNKSKYKYLTEPLHLLFAAVVVVAIVVAVIIGFRLRSASGRVSNDNKNTAETAAVTATPSPESVATPSPTPRSKAVALTFDDGPSTVNTPKVLKALKKYNAHATFFVVGSRVSEGAEILKQEVAQGCEIANHSWNHTNLAKLSMKKVNKQYDKTAKLVKKLVGYDVKLLRPPYGAISQKMRKKLKHPMILWNVDTLDWKLKNTKKILKQIKKNVKDGDIILMHDIHPTTAESLDTVLSWLVKNDYDILTVSELAERKGAPMHNGKAYGGFSG